MVRKKLARLAIIHAGYSEGLVEMKFAIMAAVCVACLGQSAPPVPTQLSVQQILEHMSANTAGLQTYQVPVSIVLRLHKAITLPISLSGTRYFKIPDKEKLAMRTVPAIAKPFQNAYATLGTSATWPQVYDGVEVAPSISTARAVYELRATYKRPSNVDHILLDVDATTFDPVQCRWFYKNGATIAMVIEEKSVEGKYRLPSRETLDVAFPSYRGNAVVEYGSYIINQDIPDATFKDGS